MERKGRERLRKRRKVHMTMQNLEIRQERQVQTKPLPKLRGLWIWFRLFLSKGSSELDLKFPNSQGYLDLGFQ